jgi:hypothetical protein
MNTNYSPNINNDYKMNSQNNGRIDIMGPNIQQFQLFDNPLTNKNSSSYNDALNGNWVSNNLSKAFFSQKNIQIIQNGIRAGVYKSSNGVYNIGPQDETNLKIIMRSIFLQNAVNNPTHIPEQIKELNILVFEYSIPKILGEAESYMKYKNDVSTLAVPQDRPAYMNSKGDKQLELKHFF